MIIVINIYVLNLNKNAFLAWSDFSVLQNSSVCVHVVRVSWWLLLQSIFNKKKFPPPPCLSADCLSEVITRAAPYLTMHFFHISCAKHLHRILLRSLNQPHHKNQLTSLCFLSFFSFSIHWSCQLVHFCIHFGAWRKAEADFDLSRPNWYFIIIAKPAFLHGLFWDWCVSRYTSSSIITSILLFMHD